MWHTILVALLGIIASGCFYLRTNMSAHARASTLIYVNTPKLALNKAYHNLETVYYSNIIHWLSHLLKIACNEIRFKISMSIFQHKYFLFKKMCNFPFPLPNILLFGKLFTIPSLLSFVFWRFFNLQHSNHKSSSLNFYLFPHREQWVYLYSLILS